MPKPPSPANIYPRTEKPPLTLRQQIEAGPVFEADMPDSDGRRCVCGDGTSPRDKETGLCVACWRVYRFSPLWSHEVRRASCGHSLHPRGFGCTRDGCPNDSRQFQTQETEV
jgi:hypothetical protein